MAVFKTAVYKNVSKDTYQAPELRFQQLKDINPVWAPESGGIELHLYEKKISLDSAIGVVQLSISEALEMAVKLLRSLGTPPDVVRQRVLEMLNSSGIPRPVQIEIVKKVIED